MRQRILLLQRAVLLAALCFSLNNAGAKQTTTATVGAMLLSNMQQTGGHRPTLNMTNRVQVRVHSREAAIKPVTDVTLDRDGAQWPPRLSAMERAEIMRPEAMRNERQLLTEPVQGAPRRHLLKGEDDDDALPFVSRPKTVKVTRAQPSDSKAKATTVSGAVSTYDEMLDDDTEVEANDPGPESTLEGKAGASQKTMEKVKSDKDAGLREGMLSLSSRLGASGKKAGGAAGGAEQGTPAMKGRTGPKGTAGSKARGSMIRTDDPTQLKGAALSGVAAAGDDSLADASLRDIRAPQKTLSQGIMGKFKKNTAMMTNQGIDVVVNKTEEPLLKLKKRAKPLKVCVMSADFWGLKTAGGTATAYHLLAAMLAKSHALEVTFLGVSKKFTICQEAKQVNTKQNLHFECLEPHHFVPEIVETYPYEQLSHAVLNWVEENADRCDVIHGHEWGGAFVDLITANNHRQIKAGLRVAVQPHGGHFWSSMGQVQRPMDIVSLRIDNQERMANMLNDCEISPTNYMIAFLRQRGWQMPEITMRIPNVIPEVDPIAARMMGKEKPIWRLAFFSRLEERKGIKLFVDAVSSLNVTDEKFEVYFVGSEAKIDMRPSSVWLREKTAKWPWKTHLRVGAKRDEALEILSSEGTLLVLCSLVDNMPYVVAEAAVKGIPFLVFDAGGVLEMFDSKAFADNVVFEPTLAALKRKLSSVVAHGRIKTVQLAEHITTGRQQWLQWHADFADNLPALIQDDTELDDQVRLLSGPEGSIRVVQLQPGQLSLKLWEPLCADNPNPGGPPLLLMPPEYEWLDPENGPRELAEIMYIGQRRNNKLGALAFGVELPNGKQAYPTSPSWMLYGGDDAHCMDNVPVLIRPETFCSVFTAEARVFRHYYSWVLAMLISQQNQLLHTFPRTIFTVKNFTVGGYSCMPDKIPIDRRISYPLASNLYKDSEELLRNLHLAPYAKPIVSLIDDFPMVQRHKGWQFGYLQGNTTRRMTYLDWVSAADGLPRDGRWSCGTHDYPSMHHSLMHPCSSNDNNCCGNARSAPFLLRYESFFHSQNALLVLAYEVWPICGDGMDFTVRLKPNGPRRAQTLLKRAYDADPNAQPNRQKIEWRMHIRTGDVLDFMVEPRGSHDCDGLYIVDIQVWSDDFAQAVEW